MYLNLCEPYAVENDMCRMGKTPNEGVLTDAFFLDRFLGFVEKYDEAFENQALPSAEKWVSEKDYASIGHFLRPNVNESVFSIPYQELANMSVESLTFLQQKAQKIAPVLDEQKALYEEFMNAYKPEESSSDSSFSYWLNRISRRHDNDLEE